MEIQQLIKYDAARNALEVASSYDEVKDIRDKAAAMAAYARQAKDTDMVKWATEIRARAERRAGQMLTDTPKHPAGRPTNNRSGDATNLPPTLAEIGISKDQSSRWQKIAAMPEEKFERAIAEAKESAGEVTSAAMLRAATLYPLTADLDVSPAVSAASFRGQAPIHGAHGKGAIVILDGALFALAADNLNREGFGFGFCKPET